MIFIDGMLIGLLYALVPGGTILIGLNLAVARGYSRAAPFTYGVLLVDVAYALLAVLGAGAATELFRHSSQNYQTILFGVQVSMIVGLCGYGAFLLLLRRPLLGLTSSDGIGVVG